MKTSKLAKTGYSKWLHERLDVQKLEIERLRGWLAYIEARCAPADECAAAARRGEPVPAEFASWRPEP